MSEASFDSVYSGPKFDIYIYIYIYTYEYIGIFILWGNKHNCLNEVVQYKTTYVELTLVRPMLYYFLVIRNISYSPLTLYTPCATYWVGQIPPSAPCPT